MKEEHRSQQNSTQPEDRQEKTEKISENSNVEKVKTPKKLSKATIWTIKITIITFFLSGVFSFISEITSSVAHVSVAFILLILLIAIGIIFDAIGVAATSCDLAPLLAMSSKKVKGAKMAVKLVKNAERVSNICCDVIGDICSIISGSCTMAIVIKLAGESGTASYWLSIGMSALSSAIMVGGKAVFKNIAVNNSKELVMLAARVLSVFSRSK